MVARRHLRPFKGGIARDPSTHPCLYEPLGTELRSFVRLRWSWKRSGGEFSVSGTTDESHRTNVLPSGLWYSERRWLTGEFSTTIVRRHLFTG